MTCRHIKAKTVPTLRGATSLAGGTGQGSAWASVGPGTKAKIMLSAHTFWFALNTAGLDFSPRHWFFPLSPSAALLRRPHVCRALPEALEDLAM